MSDNELDPGADTQMFQAFVDRQEPEVSGPRSMWLVLAAAGVVVALLVAWFLLRA